MLKPLKTNMFILLCVFGFSASNGNIWANEPSIAANKSLNEKQNEQGSRTAKQLFIGEWVNFKEHIIVTEDRVGANSYTFVEISDASSPRGYVHIYQPNGQLDWFVKFTSDGNQMYLHNDSAGVGWTFSRVK